MATALSYSSVRCSSIVRLDEGVEYSSTMVLQAGEDSPAAIPMAGFLAPCYFQLGSGAHCNSRELHSLSLLRTTDEVASENTFV
jgi:hypothetical protein